MQLHGRSLDEIRKKQERFIVMWCNMADIDRASGIIHVDPATLSANAWYCLSCGYQSPDGDNDLQADLEARDKLIEHMRLEAETLWDEFLLVRADLERLVSVDRKESDADWARAALNRIVLAPSHMRHRRKEGK